VLLNKEADRTISYPPVDSFISAPQFVYSMSSEVKNKDQLSGKDNIFILESNDRIQHLF